MFVYEYYIEVADHAVSVYITSSNLCRVSTIFWGGIFTLQGTLWIVAFTSLHDFMSV